MLALSRARFSRPVCFTGAEGFARGVLSFHLERSPISRRFFLSPTIPALLSRAPIERNARPACKSNYSRTSAIPRGGGYTGYLVGPIHFVSKSFISHTCKITVRNSFVSSTYAKTGGCTPPKMSARRPFLFALSCRLSTVGCWRPYRFPRSPHQLLPAPHPTLQPR